MINADNFLADVGITTSHIAAVQNFLDANHGAIASVIAQALKNDKLIAGVQDDVLVSLAAQNAAALINFESLHTPLSALQPSFEILALLHDDAEVSAYSVLSSITRELIQFERPSLNLAAMAAVEASDSLNTVLSASAIVAAFPDGILAGRIATTFVAAAVLEHEAPALVQFRHNNQLGIQHERTEVQSILSFGSANRVGRVKVGDVAGGSITKITHNHYTHYHQERRIDIDLEICFVTGDMWMPLACGRVDRAQLPEVGWRVDLLSITAMRLLVAPHEIPSVLRVVDYEWVPQGEQVLVRMLVASAGRPRRRVRR